MSKKDKKPEETVEQVPTEPQQQPEEAPEEAAPQETQASVNRRSEYIAGVSGFLRCRISSPSSKRAVIILSSSTKKVGVVTTISFISFVKLLSLAKLLINLIRNQPL